MSEPTGSAPSPLQEVEAAILANSVPQLSAALDHAEGLIGADLEATQDLLDSVLVFSVRQGRNPLLQHLLEEGSSISALSVLDVAYKPSLDLWSILQSHGFDFNQIGPKNSMVKGRSVIYKVTHDEKLTRWLLEECAVRVDMGEEDYWYEARPPLLLETCASIGSVGSFKLIKENGAKVGRRTLHAAVKEAAAYACDPENTAYEKDMFTKTVSGKEVHTTNKGAECGLEALPVWEHKRNREEMLRYLVDELHLDVNELDSEDVESDGSRKPSSWGRPLDYATGSTGEDGEHMAVVRWLLKKGADPNITLRNFGPAK